MSRYILMRASIWYSCRTIASPPKHCTSDLSSSKSSISAIQLLVYPIRILLEAVDAVFDRISNFHPV